VNVGTQGAPAIADINNDGFLDYVIKTQGATQVILGSGDGTFNTTSPVVVSGNGNYVDFVRAEDVNGDGKVDLVLANNNNTFQLYLGNGNGTFALPVLQSISLSSSIVQLDIGDVNGDSVHDFIMISANHHSWSYIPGTGGGSSIGTASPVLGFAPSEDNGMIATTFNGRGLAVVDWDDDGRLDVIFVRDRVGRSSLKATIRESSQHGKSDTRTLVPIAIATDTGYSRSAI